VTIRDTDSTFQYSGMCDAVRGGKCDCDGSVRDACGVCGGNGVPGDSLDECGVCGGPGFPAGKCDCDGNVLDVCGECGGSGIPTGACDCGGSISVEDACQARIAGKMYTQAELDAAVAAASSLNRTQLETAYAEYCE